MSDHQSDDWQRFNISKALKYSTEAIKAAMLINGAAAIALLAFLGASKDARVLVDIQQIRYSLMSFGAGAALCAVTFATAYLAQLFFAGHVTGETHLWAAQLLRVAALVFLFVSITLFGVGVFLAAAALSAS